MIFEQLFEKRGLWKGEAVRLEIRVKKIIYHLISEMKLDTLVVGDWVYEHSCCKRGKFPKPGPSVFEQVQLQTRRGELDSRE